MDTIACGDGMLLSFDASELSFRMGMTLKRQLIRQAKRLAAARGDRLVTTHDIEAAFQELDQQALHEAMRATNGEQHSRGTNAA